MNLRTISFWVVVLDQLSKFLIVQFCRINESIPLIRNYLYFTYIRNPGAAFGFMAETKPIFRIPFFILVTFGAGLFVYAYQRFVPPEKRRTRLALGLIWGGAMGNFIDRLLYRQVIDFIDVRYHQYQWYVFNVADSCISIGLALILVGYMLEKPALPKERF